MQLHSQSRYQQSEKFDEKFQIFLPPGSIQRSLDEGQLSQTCPMSPDESVISHGWRSFQNRLALPHCFHKTPLTACLSFSEQRSPMAPMASTRRTFHCTHPVSIHSVTPCAHPPTSRPLRWQSFSKTCQRASLAVSKRVDSGMRPTHLCRPFFATVCIATVLLLAMASVALAMPQTSASSYHKAHRRHQPPSPYSSSQSSTYQSHGYHNKYHLFSSKVQHQPKSSQQKLDSNLQQQSFNASIVNASCPNCGRRYDFQEAKNLKLEAIQQQILSKLNLIEKPKVSRDWLKREQAMEAIRKAKLNARLRGRSRSAAISTGTQHKRKRHSRRESDTPVHRRLSFSNSLHSNVTRATSTGQEANNDQFGDFYGLEDEDDEEESNDEYYGKTSEIIAFAEPGQTINGHTLVDLIPPQDNLHKLAVTKAVLWVRLIYNRTAVKRQFPNRKPVFSGPVTLYVFKVNSSKVGPDSRPMAVYPTPFFQSSDAAASTNREWNLMAGSNDSLRTHFKLLTTRRLAKPNRGWTQIDLTEAVADWFQASSNTNNKLTLLIDCAGCNQLLEIDLSSTPNPVTKRVKPPKPKSEVAHNATLSAVAALPKNTRGNAVERRNGRKRRHFQPFVVITTKTKLKRRSRRHAYNCEDGKIKQCCKQSLYVDFAQLGWDDWIIFPKGYTANYCMGECVQLHRTPDVMAYFHSHVLEEYRMKNPYASISPCCAPTKLSSISLIYFDPEGHIIKSDLPKMVVDECGCT